MIVTKAPSEPWPLVRETLEAMLAQDFPHPYDVWLADEQPSDETRAWCEAHGVRISTREGVTAYHQPSWPRRTRCKEGNLAFFYDMWGYRLYDVVAQLDADHVPARDLPAADGPAVRRPARRLRRGAEHLRPQREALVGGARPALRRGRRSTGRCRPATAAATRRAASARTTRCARQALEQVGGLGPELAEDFTTTLMMSSHGWQGVFAVEAEAHGDGPDCLEDGMTQEFQWSRSMMNVLLGISRGYWDGLSLRAKLRLGFCQLWYPLFGILMLASVILPRGRDRHAHAAHGGRARRVLPPRRAADGRAGRDGAVAASRWTGCDRAPPWRCRGRWRSSSSCAGRGRCSAACTRSPGASPAGSSASRSRRRARPACGRCRARS